MKNFWDTDKVTVCIGMSIIYLGLNTMFGNSEISPALVTGISLAGLFLTLADCFKNLSVNSNNQKRNRFLFYLDLFLYAFAAISIIAYPNFNFITSLDKQTLDRMSTTSSVIALGFVFITIGFSNIRSVFDEKRKYRKDLDEMFDLLKERSDKYDEMSNLVIDRDNKIKELEKLIQEFEKTKSLA
ncbi:hypothetical protein NLU03_10615 [Bacillus toyonensis]|nr:hypothetical protein [Bacillus toyonensis]